MQGEIHADQRIGVVGAGTMGAGIAQVAAAAGHSVRLFDADRAAVDRGIERTAAGLERLVERGKMSREEVEALLVRIEPAAALEALGDCALVIEAVVEDLGVKQRLFVELESVCPATSVLATNTSSISVTAIAAALEHPGRLIGMHFFNPAPVMKLVEVVRGLATDETVAQGVYTLCIAWGKKPVFARSTPGFIGNRVARPFYSEALRLLQDGAADAATIDAALRDCGGFRMGPFELMDLIGVEVNLAVTRTVFEATFGDPKYRPSLLQQELVDAGYLGRKSGRGFYDYAEDAPAPQAREAAEAPAPEAVIVHGDLGPAEPLAALLEHSPVHTTREETGEGYLHTHEAVIALSDGRSATERSARESVADLVVFDLALDYEGTPRIVLAAADQASDAARRSAVGLFQALGKRVSVVDDAPGLILMRTVAMLANDAADAVGQRICSAADLDTAMRFGFNYPRGPLAWADAIGPGRVLAVIDHLARAYAEDRYRPAPLLQRRVAAHRGLHD